MKKDIKYYGTGKRKSAIAKVTLTPGKGKITVNGRDVNEYFPFATLVLDLKQPLEYTSTTEIFDVNAVVKGGGFSGQSGAIRHGITKALLQTDESAGTDEATFRKILKSQGFITRDSRIKERKKPGLKKARRAPQFSKR